MSAREPIDPLKLEAIVPQGRTFNLYFRHVHIPASGNPNPLFIPSNTHTRWATTKGTLYTATAERVTWSEYCRQIPDDIEKADPTGRIGLTRNGLHLLHNRPLKDPVSSRALYGVTVHFERVADLTDLQTQSILQQAGFDLNDFFKDDYGRCPEVATAGESLGWQGLITPSAAWRRAKEFCVPIFANGQKLITDIRKLNPEVKPTVLIAFATHYRAGERPQWLKLR